jgi:hypothetical protein
VITSWAVVMAGLLLVCFMAVPFLMVSDAVQTAVGNVPGLPAGVQEGVQVSLNHTDSSIDFLMFGIIMLLGVIDIYLNSRIRSSAVFLAILFLLLLIGAVVAFSVHSFYDDWRVQEGVNTYVVRMPIMDWILRHSVQFFLFLAFLSSVAFFVTPTPQLGEG